MDDLDKAVRYVAKAARDSELGQVTEIRIHLQASGECPYQIDIVHEPLPHAGIVSIPPQR